jgi:hypothetical protein
MPRPFDDVTTSWEFEKDKLAIDEPDTFSTWLLFTRSAIVSLFFVMLIELYEPPLMYRFEVLGKLQTVVAPSFSDNAFDFVSNALYEPVSRFRYIVVFVFAKASALT